MTAAAAFASLPERWRTVLWHTEVEEETPAEIAPLLGMRPNGVAALAYRAREGLRQAYLRAHLREVESRECQATVAKLAGWVRGNVPVPLGCKITRHLAGCPDCRARADTLTKINEELRASVALLLLAPPSRRRTYHHRARQPCPAWWPSRACWRKSARQPRSRPRR